MPNDGHCEKNGSAHRQQARAQRACGGWLWRLRNPFQLQAHIMSGLETVFAILCQTGGDRCRQRHCTACQNRFGRNGFPEQFGYLWPVPCVTRGSKRLYGAQFLNPSQSFLMFHIDGVTMVFSPEAHGLSLCLRAENPSRAAHDQEGNRQVWQRMTLDLTLICQFTLSPMDSLFVFNMECAVTRIKGNSVIVRIISTKSGWR